MSKVINGIDAAMIKNAIFNARQILPMHSDALPRECFVIANKINEEFGLTIGAGEVYALNEYVTSVQPTQRDVAHQVHDALTDYLFPDVAA